MGLLPGALALQAVPPRTTGHLSRGAARDSGALGRVLLDALEPLLGLRLRARREAALAGATAPAAGRRRRDARAAVATLAALADRREERGAEERDNRGDDRPPQPD